MSSAPRSPRKIFIALFLFLAVLAWSLMQTSEYFVNGKGLDSDWLNPRTWLTPLSDHEALGQAGVNLGRMTDLYFIDALHGWATGDGVIFVTTNGGKDWEPQQNDGKTWFGKVRFIDHQHGWAVGVDGVIFATINGGKDWKPQLSGVNSNLYSIQFIDQQQGWVLGNNGVILKTDNGGQNWKSQQSGVKTRLSSAHFIDSLHGWAVGDKGIILVTYNGGQSWGQQQSGVGSDFQSVQFTDQQHGWITSIDGKILATDNGGQTWQIRYKGSTSLKSVQFIDSQHGWAVGVTTILATANGGYSWQPQQSGINIKEGILEVVHFSDGQHGWAAGDSIILTTNNGGKNWQPLQRGVNTRLLAVWFIEQQHGWAVGHDGIILTTINGGQSWQLQQSDVKTILSDVQFIDQQHGWVVGWNGTILVTDNGGQIWRQQQSGVTSNFHAVEFRDSQHGWVVGDGTLLATANGGQSWELQHSEDTFNSVQFIDQQHGLAAGSAIVATINGGQSWQLQHKDKIHLNSVQFIDEQQGWAIGEGHILTTANGGKSWQQQSDVKEWLWAIRFFDSQHGWAVGHDGIILATDNGGQSWRSQQSGVSTWLDMVQFTDLQHGWAVGEKGIILATDNGGTTWQNRSPDPKIFAEGRSKLIVFPSPLALLLLLLTGLSLFLHTYRYYAKPRSLQGGISDAPVSQAQEDCLGRLELVKTLADLIRNRDTVPPLAIAITAPWGSGKSSVLGLLQHELQGEVFAVQLNAWHYRDDGQLLAALMEHVREQALPPMLSLDNLLFRVRLLWFRCFAGSGFRGLTALLAGLTATAFFAKQQQWQVLGDWLSCEVPALIPAWLQTSTAEPWFKLVFAVLAVLLVYRLLKSWLAALSAFSPELVALATRLSKSAKEAMQVADWSKDAGLRFRFARDFETVAKALGKGRLLLLIDDLDRCEPKQIESVMTTLNFLFSTPAPCYAVLAMDWEYVTDALGVAFKELAVARADTDTKGKKFAEHYLEKIIQIRIDLPAVDGSRVALIDHSRRTPDEVVDWWGKLTGYWPWLNAMDRVFYPPTPTLSLREMGLDSAGDWRWARFAAAVLQSPLRLLVSVVWRGLEAGLWMCWQAMKGFNSKMLTPVSDGLLILLLATALAFTGVQLVLVVQDVAGRQVKIEGSAVSEASAVGVLENAKPESGKKQIEASESKAAAAPVVFVDEQRYPTHYWLWAAAGCLSLMLLVMVWRLSLRVQDTHAFIAVMTEWKLWLAAHHDTPRDWKRLLNRARLFAMRVRVYRQKPWYAALDEKWQAWRFRRQPFPTLFQHDELDEHLAMHLLMLDVYTKGELAESVLQFFRHNLNTESFDRLKYAFMKKPPNAFPELSALMNDLNYRYTETTDEQFAALKKAEAQLGLWLNLYAGLNTLCS